MGIPVTDGVCVWSTLQLTNWHIQSGDENLNTVLYMHSMIVAFSYSIKLELEYLEKLIDVADNEENYEEKKAIL